MGSITLLSNQDAPANPPLTALIKGAGPSGLAAAVSLAQLNFQVTLTEKRSWRPHGAGRQNMVAIRPDVLRVLDGLGALRCLLEFGALTEMVEGVTVDEWMGEGEEGRVFDWGPLFLKFPHGYDTEKEGLGDEDDDRDGGLKEYTIPEKVSDQVPAYFVDLGQLEDALLQVCEGLENVRVVNEATVELVLSKNGNRYDAVLIEDLGKESEKRSYLSCPDLVVCASGKNDITIAENLNFQRRVGVKLDENALPEPGSRTLLLGDERELESQLFAVFGVKNSKRRMGVIEHLLRKEGTGEPPQPICEIEMSHKGTSHCIFCLPRGMDLSDKAGLERYVIKRINARLSMDYNSFKEMSEQDVLVAGDPTQPVLVETSTAPMFVYVSNVVLVGDAAMCCSPSSGIGADIGVSVDSRSIRQLGGDLIAAKKNECKEEQDQAWEEALDRFNARKAESAVIWSQASRKFYMGAQEAKAILEQVKSSAMDRL